MLEPLRIGVAGLGTVGAAVVRIARPPGRRARRRCGRDDPRHRRLGARPGQRPRHRHLAGSAWFDDPVALARSRRDRLRRRAHRRRATAPAKAAVEAALAAGKHVVTANKALLAQHGARAGRRSPRRRASRSPSRPRWPAASRSIKTLREGLPGNAVARVYGILNGTCNYILTRMEREGLAFADCLKDAQRARLRRGRPDLRRRRLRHRPQARDPDEPRLRHRDRRRGDLCRGHLDDHPARPHAGRRARLPDQAARRRRAHRGRHRAARAPDHGAESLRDRRRSMGVTNAVAIEADAVRELTLIGPGAGGDATASAVVADIADIARGTAARPSARPAARLEPAAGAPMQRHEGGYYIRLDRPRPARRRGAASRAAWPTRRSRSRASSSSGSESPRRRTRRPLRRAGAAHPDHLRGDRRRRSARRSTRSRPTASSPSRRR